MSGRVLLSIVIKALNEERNIARTLRSALNAAAGLSAEVILADSKSTDRTVEIARNFPVTVVQLENAHERSCGIGAQLGYQHARGEFILVMDGDMEVEGVWLGKALDYMRSHPEVGGVGGVVDDINLDNIEFRARQQRKPKDMMPGEVERLDMGGLYRCQAIESVGYLTNRNLHACEELELGLRLSAAGWKMVRIDEISIRHYGHTVPTLTLMRKRWASRYSNGAGELIRASIGQPWFACALLSFKLRIMVIGWWGVILVAALAALWRPDLLWLPLAVVAAPPLLMILKKRSVAMGLYSILSWTVDTAGLIRGLLSSVKAPPEGVVASKVVHDGNRSFS
jgi:glycosyltransferase involved in cell wall biosynthesis